MSLFYLSSDLLETSANIVERPLLLSARKLKLHKEDIDSGNFPTGSLFCCRECILIYYFRFLSHYVLYLIRQLKFELR